MRYDNSSVRRQDRLLAEEEARRLLREGEYGFLALQNDCGTGGYGVPLSYVRDGERIYFHCAPEGRKLRCLQRAAGATFCVVGRTRPVPERFTTEYESILLEGDVVRVDDEGERMHALELLLDKYSPADKATGMRYAAASFARTAVLRLTVRCWSGKCKRVG